MLRDQFRRRIAERGAPLRLYGILDAETCARRGHDLRAVARAWRQAGVRLVQYRDKQGTDEAVLENACAIAREFEGTDAFLFLNDRVHLVDACGFHGAHVGQTDTSVAEARAALGPERLLGVSTHSIDQAAAADREDVDYLAIGPVRATATKLNAEPVVGLEGVRIVRACTRKPLVAIGGISAADAAEVRAHGADAVAVISALVPAGAGADALAKSAQDFLAAFA